MYTIVTRMHHSQYSDNQSAFPFESKPHPQRISIWPNASEFGSCGILGNLNSCIRCAVQTSDAY